MNKYLLALVCASFFACTVPVDVDSSGDPSIPRHPTDMGGGVFATPESDDSDGADAVHHCQLLPGYCDDDNPCTEDTCTMGGCVYTDASAATSCYEEGGTGQCHQGNCCIGYVSGGDTCLSCSDGNECTFDAPAGQPGLCFHYTYSFLHLCEINGTVGKCYADQCLPL